MKLKPTHRPGTRLVLVFLVSLVASPLSSQGVDPPRGNSCVSFDLPSGHWAIAALRRLEGAGLAAVQFTKRTFSACEALQVLEATAADGAGGLSGQAALWSARLKEEYPRLLPSEGGPFFPVLTGGLAEMGVESRVGNSAPGLAEFPPDRTGAIPLGDRSIAVAAGELSGRLGSHLSGVANVGLDLDGVVANRLEAVGGVGPVSLAIGRGAIGYGFARGGSLALSGSVPLDRVQIDLSKVDLPRPFPWLVSITFGTFVGRVDEDRQPGNPFLWGASGSIRTHPRLTFTATRAALFGGGTSPNEQVTGERILDMLLGKIDGKGFEDQMASIEGVFRLPTEAFLPLTLFAEWGAEDLSGAPFQVPGFIVGVHLPAIPGAPELSGGFEYTSMARSCCKNPEWYRHVSFPGSWTLGGEPLGHPLGGNGTEWLAFANFDAPATMMTLGASAFKRFYGPQNLFVPGRDGSSVGIKGEAQWRVLDQREIFGSVRIEQGEGWQESGFSVGGRFFLR